MHRLCMPLCVSILLSVTAFARADEPSAGLHPKAVDDRLKIELFAEHPDLVTPTGLDVDHQGRIWVIESNTHLQPVGYKGHPTDRLLVMHDKNGDRRATGDEVTVFADGLTHTMSVAVKPLWLETSADSKSGGLRPPLTVYIATRKEILLFTDTDGDLKADKRERLVALESEGDYPHNGLAGFAFDALGWMYFGVGENLGIPYKIAGSDGKNHFGGGEGGNIFRCKPDGSGLKHWATGFWNPHASCIDAFGRMFTVDNDPDSRPPCRLLHIIPGGDYGFRFRLGRKGLHPFTSWNGEIPGTLPMVAGTGEAPSGILAYESDGLPEDYIGNLIVTSWGDHRIDRFRLKPKGASFESLADPIVQGGEGFRPVGIACAPDGSLYFSDWVLSDYKVHGKGRVWRISSKKEPKRKVIDIATIKVPNSKKELEELLQSPRLDVRRMVVRRTVFDGGKWEWCRELAKTEIDTGRLKDGDNRVFEEIMYLDPDTISVNPRLTEVDIDHRWNTTESLFSDVPYSPFHLARALWLFGQGVPEEWFLKKLKSDRTQYQETGSRDGNSDKWIDMVCWLAARKQHPKSAKLVDELIQLSNVAARRLAVQWIAEEKLTSFRPQVTEILNDPAITADLFLATLAALEMLDGIPPQEFDMTPPGKYVIPIVRNKIRPAAVRALALRLVPPDDPALDGELLANLLATDDPALKRETIRTLNASPVPQAAELLRGIVKNDQQPLADRIEATVGLAASAGGLDPKTLETLADLTYEPPAQFGSDSYIEALRSLRGVAVKDAELDMKLSQLAPPSPPTTPAELDLAEQLSFALVGSRYGLEAPIAQAIAKRRPKTAEEWLAELEGEGNAERGRRVFFHANSAGCFKCHTFDGRGGKIGPDLTNFGRNATPEKVLTSILTPSSEISPQFTTWTLVDKDGRTYSGMIVHENEGKTLIGDTEGKLTELATIDITERVAQKVSVMPEKLIDKLTVQELRDLVAFLRDAPNN